MAVRDDRGDVKQTTTGFRGPLMVQSLTSAKSKFLSLGVIPHLCQKQIPIPYSELSLPFLCALFQTIMSEAITMTEAIM